MISMSFQTQALCAQLSQLRTERKLSQRQLAADLKLPQSYISNIENGKIDIGLSNFVELARYLGVEVMLIPLPLVHTVKAIVEPGEPGQVERKPLWAVDSPEEE